MRSRLSTWLFISQRDCRYPSLLPQWVRDAKTVLVSFGALAELHRPLTPNYDRRNSSAGCLELLF
jgi:hypothetical protein